MARSETFSQACSKVGSFSHYNNFTLYVELTDRDGNSATNKSYTDYKVYCSSNGAGSLNSKHAIYFELDGQIIVNQTVTWSASSPYISILIAQGTKEIDHNDKSSIYFNAWIQASSYGVSAARSGYFELEHIPRYTTVWNSERGKTINTISINWSTADARDWTQYCIDDGAWQNAYETVASDNKSGYYTIYNLEPNTTYKIRTRCRRTDSGLWSEAGNLWIRTYDIARITEAPNFTDEENPTIKYLNPFGNNVTTLQACISLTGATDDIAYRDISKTGTSYTFELTDEERELLRSAATENTLNIKFHIKTIYTQTYYSYVSKTMSIVNANPIFYNFTYKDINTDIVDNLTGNNQTIIKGYSNVRGLVSVANKAIPQKHATMNKYRLSIGEAVSEVNYSDTEDVSTTIEKATSNIITMYAIDSRENSTAKQIIASNFIDYKPIVIKTMSVTRKGNIQEETSLQFEGSIWDGNFGIKSNSINSCYYRYRNTTQNTWSENININPEKEGDSFSFNAIISGDLGAVGFDIEESFEIQVFIADELSNNIENPSTFILGPGIPALAIYKNKVATGGKYDEELGGTFQIFGDAYKDGKPLEIKPRILYANETGTAGTVQLSENSEKFRYIEIISHRDGRYYSSGKIPSPNGKDVILSTSYRTIDGDMTFYQYSKQVNIVGTSIIPVYAILMYCSTGGTVVVNTDDSNKIAKVIGYE